MDEKKNKKKTLTISTSFNKKIDASSFKGEGKKTYSIAKKKPFKSNKNFNKNIQNFNQSNKPDNKKSFARKFVEQQATKDFIKKDQKSPNKNKLKVKGNIDKRNFKLTVSRALNVEEIEIKQRSLASVKRARLKEKKASPEPEEKKNLKDYKRSKNS